MATFRDKRSGNLYVNIDVKKPTSKRFLDENIYERVADDTKPGKRLDLGSGTTVSEKPSEPTTKPGKAGA